MPTVLAFDFGEKRIGVAVGETLLAQAHPLTVIATGDRERRWQAIAALVAEWQPVRLVVGLPTHVDGTAHAMTERCRRFGDSLRRRHALPVDFADERLSSLDAQSRLRETGRNARSAKGVLDAVAAQLILQTWFECHANDLSSPA
ncbi:MAG: Holliday junction resolvase RuvX [Azonexus sp.]|nr:Holliday junction resolvase RuvX [Betaproteobacteria bacterium]MBK8919376.1 Holliday junction resolvase RuvX [Betaproteobacteria bacterium]MBP6037247.1 Holliday junction resolvase RuvX [Azonexus sp.]MBP6907790.1 Holliday junction resolvase RuvX [Azonexus sp.]